MWPHRFSARVLTGLSFGLVALLVLGHHRIDAAGHRVGLHVFGPVHRRRLERVGGKARLQQHLGLVGKAVLGGQLALAVHQRQPGHRAVGVEAGDREHAVVENVLAGGGIGRVVGLGRDEAVDVFEIVVVAHVDDDAAVLVDNDGRGLVRHAAERGALHRLGGRIVRVDLDHPVEAVGLVRLLARCRSGRGSVRGHR